tara:strand:+ start:207 stop:944 length:738 start_codon:yes stop_codon:yes gene_type:complete
MHPVEALKKRVLAALKDQPSRDVIRRTLVAEGHPEGLVSAAIELAFQERQVRAERQRGMADESSRRGMVAKLAGPAVVHKIDDEDFGDIRGGARAHTPYVMAAITALLCFGIGVAVPVLLQIHVAYAAGVALVLAGCFTVRTTLRAFEQRGTILVVCTEGLVEVTRGGRIRGHSWSKVTLVERGRRSPGDNGNTYSEEVRTIHSVKLKIGERSFDVQGMSRDVALFSAALSSQIDAYARGGGASW